MAPLPPNSTARFWFDYTTGSGPLAQTHTTMWRVPDEGASSAAVQAKFVAFLAAIGVESFWTGWRVTAVRYSDIGSNFSFPVPLETTLAAFAGDNDTVHPLSDEAREYVWTGRSPVTGRRVDFSLYGLAVPTSPTFRYTVGDIGPTDIVAVSIDALENTPQIGPLAIDGAVPVWYPYVNVNFNSYWEGELRS